MIIKVIQESSFSNLEEFEFYNSEKEEEVEELENSASTDEELGLQFEYYDHVGERDHNFLHIIVSFALNEKKLPNDKMKEIGKDVLKGLDLDNLPHKIYKHNDEDHQHFHIYMPKPVDGKNRKFRFFSGISLLIKNISKKHNLIDLKESLKEADTLDQKKKLKDYGVPEYLVNYQGPRNLLFHADKVTETVNKLLVEQTDNLTSYAALNRLLKPHDLKAGIHTNNKMVFFKLKPSGRKQLKLIKDKNGKKELVPLNISIDKLNLILNINTKKMESLFAANLKRLQKKLGTQIQKNLKEKKDKPKGKGRKR
jgi:hypothetical protein